MPLIFIQLIKIPVLALYRFASFAREVLDLIFYETVVHIEII